MPHSLSYKNCGESTTTTLESQALIVRNCLCELWFSKGLFEAHLRTEGFSRGQKPQPGCQISNLPLKLEALELWVFFFFQRKSLKNFKHNIS